MAHIIYKHNYIHEIWDTTTRKQVVIKVFGTVEKLEAEQCYVNMFYCLKQTNLLQTKILHHRFKKKLEIVI